MKTPFYNTADRVLRLNLAAAKWKGTPWRPNSQSVGVGVSCHNLPRALYIETHFLTESFPRIESLPHQATAENQMETFLDARPEFHRINVGQASCLSLYSSEKSETGETPILRLQPGDLLGLFLPIDNVGKRLRRSCVNHLGVVLGESPDHATFIAFDTRRNTQHASLFIHTLMKKNTDIDSFLIPPWSTVIRAAWRPVEVSSSEFRVSSSRSACPKEPETQNPKHETK